jgi:hypothetical protein
MRSAALLLALLLSAGCAGTLCDQIDYGGIHVNRGMRIDEVQALLGEPHLVYHGRDQLRFVEKFWRLPFGWSGATEWVWLKCDPAIVVWSHDGVVTSMGTIPREVAQGVPRPPVSPPHEELAKAQRTFLGDLVYAALYFLAYH